MQKDRAVKFGLGIALVLSLSACLDGAGQGSDTSRPAQAVERDIEAPNVFSKRDRALWDGRPSLGGVWVAHPDVRAPERVLIRNTETGRETIGALFKRERMNPGPVFQVSADAATAIGMLAGAPTGIEVIALRTEEIRPAAAEELANVETASAPPAPAPAAVTPAPGPVSAPAPVASAAAATDTVIPLPESDPEAAAPRQGFFARVFGRGGQAPATEQIETAVLADGTAPAPALAGPVSTGPTPMPTPISSAASAPTPAPASAASSLAQPFIQLGIFSVEANATRAQKLASDAGLNARVVRGQAQSNTFWRVIVGPAADTAESRAQLAKVKSLGFNDAYTVRR
ncbi:MAG: SPOR domain-containing protein [Roseinatronobacter sp.]